MVLKIEYFFFRGLAEYARTLLIDHGIYFIDDRVELADWTPEKKAAMPLGQMPVLNVGDWRIPQTGAIMRYLGRKYNLYGDDENDAIFLDILHETIKDVSDAYGKMAYTDWGSKEKFDSEIYPRELKKIEKLITSRGNFANFILGDKVSFVDYILFEELELSLASNPNNLDCVPSLKAYHDRFVKRPNLKEYFAKRAADKIPFMGAGNI